MRSNLSQRVERLEQQAPAEQRYGTSGGVGRASPGPWLNPARSWSPSAGCRRPMGRLPNERGPGQAIGAAGGSSAGRAVGEQAVVVGGMQPASKDDWRAADDRRGICGYICAAVARSRGKASAVGAAARRTGADGMTSLATSSQCDWEPASCNGEGLHAEVNRWLAKPSVEDA